MPIQDVTPKQGLSEEELEMFGMEVSVEEWDTDYIPRRSIKDMEKVSINDLKAGKEVTGEPDFAIYINDEKEINGKKFKEKTYDSINMRLFSDTDYLEVYINIPKVDKNGFITNIHKENQFYENCFNLIFGYMRQVNEDGLVDPDSENGYINFFNKININYLVEKLNELTDIKIKVTEGHNGYHGFLITEIWD